ncbi:MULTISPECIES: lasso peptide biosynthesis B2 protein [Microbacterium]|uniref:lasso peptide biosynthesis B2 protein n=1 Tax=uncultured Microbacterium sp. TaxID=191216 RepID=UPI002622804F|nr:lasso peptide biosynthesis B2 protein [uncultured Microbacterium sp.]
MAAVVATRVERALARGGVDRAAAIGRVRVAMDGQAAPVVAVADAPLSEREREKIDTAWRMLQHPPFNGTCLRRAIVGGYFLRDREPILRIGVTKTAGVVAAHAWIEIDGAGLDPDGAEKYSVLTRPVGEQ